MFFNSVRRSRSCSSTEELTVFKELHRLRLLENAVVNYGGGVKSLEARADQEAKKLRGRNTAVSELLADVARYLHDIAEAGHLDVTDWRPAREEVLPCKDDFVEKK